MYGPVLYPSTSKDAAETSDLCYETLKLTSSICLILFAQYLEMVMFKRSNAILRDAGEETY